MKNGVKVTTMNTFPYIELHHAILTSQASLYVLFSATCQLSNDSIVERRNATQRLLFWAPGWAICRPAILKALLSLSSCHTSTRLKSSKSNNHGLQCQSEARFLVAQPYACNVAATSRNRSPPRNFQVFRCILKKPKENPKGFLIHDGGTSGCL